MQEPQETEVQSLGREGPLEWGMATTPVFLPGDSHEQRRSLVGYAICREMAPGKVRQAVYCHPAYLTYMQSTS